MAPRHELLEERLTQQIIGSFFDVYNYYGFGLLASVYANALEEDLTAKGLHVQREVSLVVYYKRKPIARQRIDMLVEGKVIVENKATEHLSATAEPQLLNYLKATGIQLGLLLHFGPKPKFRRLIYTKEDVSA